MKKILLPFLFIITSLSASYGVPPGDITMRSMVDTTLYPFYHGVASGDPTPNSVIIWTRVTPDLPGTVTGTWRVALDTNFSSIVQSGTFSTDSTVDYTVKIDVTGLLPATWYFYEFTALDKNSLTGRTKTAPVSGTSQLRFGFVSCSNYPTGYFNVYDRVKARNDIDAVLHLGDYIYESAGTSAPPRNDQMPQHEIIKLADYRQRYSSYRLDPSCRKVHQQYPFMTVWDDHETANNSWNGGSDNHSPGTEGPWADRKAAGQQAYDEWLPIRLPEAGNPNKIWRKISYGNMADIFMLDTRLYARTIQGGNATDTNRHIIGNEQLAWLKAELMNSTAKWKILSQQVMVGNLTPFNLVVNDDQWDGYQADKKKLYDIILNNNIKNVIVLTGDIHTAWAMDLPYNTATYNPATGSGSVGVEFVCSSVTSSSSPVPLDPVSALITAVLPHIKYVDLHKKGYGVLDLRDTVAQGNFFSIPTIQTRDTQQRYETGYYTIAGTRWLKKAPAQSLLLAPKQYQAPETPRQNITTGIKNKSNNLVVLSAYPNPFIDKVMIQFNTASGSNLDIKIYDMSGRLVKQENFGFLAKGLYNKTVELNDLASGAYKFVLTNDTDLVERTIEKF